MAGRFVLRSGNYDAEQLRSSEPALAQRSYGAGRAPLSLLRRHARQVLLAQHGAREFAAVVSGEFFDEPEIARDLPGW